MAEERAGRPKLGPLGVFRAELAAVIGFVVYGGFVVLGDALAPERSGGAGSTIAFLVLFAVMLWCAFGVVRHADSLAALLGEPYGTLILTLSVIGIEVALITSIMLTADSPTLARDTMFSVLMIVLNGLVGLSLLLGGLRHHLQRYNLRGANAYLSVLATLAVVGLILPSVTVGAPGGALTPLQAVFDAGMAIVLYGIFLAIQTTSHSDFFLQPPGQEQDDDDIHHYGKLVLRSVPYHAAALALTMLPIVLLSKQLATYLDFGTAALSLPAALGGFVVAILVLTPEGLSAIRAALDNRLQRAVNICLGSALATIGLTIPAVLTIHLITGKAIVLGLDAADITMLAVTLLVSVLTFGSPRTHTLQGLVHLALFAAYVVLIFDAPPGR